MPDAATSTEVEQQQQQQDGINAACRVCLKEKARCLTIFSLLCVSLVLFVHNILREVLKDQTALKQISDLIVLLKHILQENGEKQTDID